MSRPRFGKELLSVTETFRLPEEIALAFREEAGKDRAEILRKLVVRWLLRRRAIARKKLNQGETP